MTINELAKIVALKEGKKRQISIAQIKEVLAIIADLGPDANECLWRYFKRRRQRKLKSKKRTKKAAR